MGSSSTYAIRNVFFKVWVWNHLAILGLPVGFLVPSSLQHSMECSVLGMWVLILGSNVGSRWETPRALLQGLTLCEWDDDLPFFFSLLYRLNTQTSSIFVSLFFEGASTLPQRRKGVPKTMLHAKFMVCKGNSRTHSLLYNPTIDSPKKSHHHIRCRTRSSTDPRV